jgi:hypothetical protein
MLRLLAVVVLQEGCIYQIFALKEFENEIISSVSHCSNGKIESALKESEN